VVRWLSPERGGLFVDCTVGLGGHAAALLAASSSVRLIGIDRDRRALMRARSSLRRFGNRSLLVEGNFRALPLPAADTEAGSVAGILADLGVSSLQLETAERGFSFQRLGPLDMRMGRSGRTAGEIVNQYSEAELVKVFSQYGEERQARRVARAIVERRAHGDIATTSELRKLVREAKGLRAGEREGRIDPATRVFQALRIEVNQELDSLQRLVDEAAHLLAQDGRLVVISYHSLEDRIVKNTLRRLAVGKIDEITGRPHAETRLIEVLTRKPVRASAAEVEVNPRARSARLRAARRL
jgi:16S rRNA (cytosine1402-N4)-methyltransferase